MTIVSTGYTGAIAPNVTWANMQKALGSQYMVDKPGDALVTAVSGGTRQVQVATGFIGGCGILDQITAVEVVTLDPVASGTHYWLICGHRDWSANLTTITAVDAGTALPSTLPARATGPGTLDEQPLALVSIAANDTIPKIVYDLRALGGPDSYVMSADLAGKPNWFAYLARPGIRIRCDSTTYTRAVDPRTGNGVWDIDPTIARSNSTQDGLSIVGVPGWTTKNDVESKGVRSGNKIEMILQVVHDSNQNPIDFSTAKGATNDTTVLIVNNSDWHPPSDIPGVSIEYLDADGASYGGTATYTTAGELIIRAGAPATSVGVRTNGTWSVRALVSWIREG